MGQANKPVGANYSFAKTATDRKNNSVGKPNGTMPAAPENATRTLVATSGKEEVPALLKSSGTAAVVHMVAAEARNVRQPSTIVPNQVSPPGEIEVFASDHQKHAELASRSATEAQKHLEVVKAAAKVT